MSVQPGKSQQAIRMEVLKGWSFQGQLERPNVVRIFLSSTFHDFIEERNYLFKEIIPKLEKWCQERGLEFQVSDMRWGIRDTGDSDHDATNMCLKEVQHCQKLSIGPNFVAFVGDRYGRRPLPSSILALEFDQILAHTSYQSERDLLTSWYQTDANSVPAVRLRRNARENLSNYDSETASLREKDRKEWAEIQQKLGDIFWNSAKKAVQAERLEFAYRFVASATEQEIWAGILSQENPEKQALCFMRTLKDLKVDKNNKKTQKYLDLMDSNFGPEMDQRAKAMLGELKNLLIPAKLNKSNIFQYTLDCDPQQGVNPKLSKHAKYLHDLGETFSSKVIDLIVEALKQIHTVSVQDPLYKEVVQHANFVVQKAQLYCGQEKILDKLFKRFSDKKNNQPIILYGESGVGKTATVAKLIQESWKQIDGPPNIVYRFLGITPASSSIDSLFLSLSNQICELYDLKSQNTKKDDFNLLRPYFYELLDQVSRAASGDSKPQLIIILDSLDQLSPAYGAHLMNWLQDSLPSGVKLLLTVMPNYQNILTRLQARLKPNNFVEITQLGNEAATDVLAKLLVQNHRKLQPVQLEMIGEVLKDAQTPLLLHMTVIEASQWHSYTPEDQLKLGSTVREAIHILFERLERNHGKILVSHALSCLVAAK